MSRYSEACDAGYDGASPFEERRLAARKRANDMLDPRDPDYVDHDDEEQEGEGMSIDNTLANGRAA